MVAAAALPAIGKGLTSLVPSLGSAIGTGITALGVASSIPLVSGFGDQIRESKLRQGPNDLTGEFDTNFLENLLIQEETLMPQYQKIKQKEYQSNPQVMEYMSKGIRGPAIGEDLNAYLTTNRPDYRRLKQKEAGEDYTFAQNLQWGTLAAQRQRRLEDAAIRNAQIEREFNMGRLQAQDRRAQEAQIETNRINLFKAMNENNLSIANLDLRKQDQANNMEIYRQKLADTKELRQNALLAAVVDGIGLTASGLFS